MKLPPTGDAGPDCLLLMYVPGWSKCSASSLAGIPVRALASVMVLRMSQSFRCRALHSKPCGHTEYFYLYRQCFRIGHKNSVTMIKTIVSTIAAFIYFYIVCYRRHHLCSMATKFDSFCYRHPECLHLRVLEALLCEVGPDGNAYQYDFAAANDDVDACFRTAVVLSARLSWRPHCK